MKLLLQAALRAKKHLMLFFITLFSLLFLTIASQMEIFALGVLSNNGSDFFALFSKEQSGGVSLPEIQGKWDLVADKNTSLVTQQSAASYLSSQKETNPLNWVLRVCKEKLDLTSNIKAMVLLLLCVAAFKAIWLFASRYSTSCSLFVLARI